MIMGMAVIVLVGMLRLFGKLGKRVSERGVRVLYQLDSNSDLFGWGCDAFVLQRSGNLLIPLQVIEVVIYPVFQADSTFLDLVHEFSTLQ